VCDNVKDLFADAGCNARCRIYHARTKHIEIDFHPAPVHPVAEAGMIFRCGEVYKDQSI
jgi:hypothetical protein